MTQSNSMPDGVQGQLALEVKYVDDFQRSPRNPDYVAPYPNNTPEDDVEQAKKYDRDFSDGVSWVTNNPDFAAIYASKFTALGLKRTRVATIPSR